jgi:Rieske Fe-S protein
MSVPAPSSRREFIRIFVFGAATAAVLGQPWRRTYLAEAAEAASDGSGLLQIRLSDYPSLLNEMGSVRIGLNGIADDNTGPLGFFYPILINRGSGDQFYALDSGCSHAGCVVGLYDEFEGAIICPCHDSHYNIDGTVWEGQEAKSSLRSLPVTYDGADTLSIRVPFLGYSVNAALVSDSEPPRLRLTFQTRGGVLYEVRHRATLHSDWMPVRFAISETGPIDQAELSGTDLEESIYVSRIGSTGFFSIAIRVLDLTPT